MRQSPFLERDNCCCELMLSNKHPASVASTTLRVEVMLPGTKLHDLIFSLSAQNRSIYAKTDRPDEEEQMLFPAQKLCQQREASRRL